MQGSDGYQSSLHLALLGVYGSITPISLCGRAIPATHGSDASSTRTTPSPDLWCGGPPESGNFGLLGRRKTNLLRELLKGSSEAGEKEHEAEGMCRVKSKTRDGLTVGHSTWAFPSLGSDS